MPRIASPTDVSNFSEEFTNMEPVDSPGAEPGPEVAENLFAEYSYVAPSILFTENNVISEDMFRPNPDKKPSTSNLVGCILQVSRSARVAYHWQSFFKIKFSMRNFTCQIKNHKRISINDFHRFFGFLASILVLVTLTQLLLLCWLRVIEPRSRSALRP